MKEGFYKLGAETSSLYIYTYKSGSLSLLSHDLLIKVNEFCLDFDLKSRNAGESKMYLTVETNSLEVICVVIGEKRYEKLLTEKDKREIEKNIKSDQILAVRKYPTIKFVSNHIKEEENCFLVSGELTIKKLTKGLNLTLMKDIEKPYNKLTGRCTILQSDFGLVPYSTLFGVLGVRDRLDISWEINL
ncbi:MAG: YceI family protein [Candidatus Firestonebacteria bacterium]|nr:YceI family protein [Candidatus Firestonebacteria bacterium]